MGTSLAPGQLPLDPAKLRRMLGSAELSWLVDRIRAKLERGERLDGTVTLVGATPAQRRAAARLLGRRAGRGTSLSVPLPVVARQLYRAGAASSLQAAVVELSGPVRDLAAERAAGLRQWGEALEQVRTGPLAGLPWYRDWIEALRRDGNAARLLRLGTADVLGQAAAVLERFQDGEPAVPVLAALAAEVTGDELALAGGPLADLVLRALAIREGVQAPASAEAARVLWSAVGMASDDLASQVLVLNVRAGGEPVGRWMTEAAQAGQPFRVTLSQLTRYPVLPWALDIYVCGNPAVVRAAADEFGPDCPALVCTEGEPSVACTRLLQAAATSGSIVHWHADFSWHGLRATSAAIRRLWAHPWQMAAADYQDALASGIGTEPLTGPAQPSPWDPRLSELMQRSGRAITEGRILESLLAELAAHQRVN